MTRKFTIPALIALVLVLFTGNALAVNPAVIYDMGGKFDKSFNQAAHMGAEKFSNEFGIKYRDFEPTNESQYEQALRRFAARGNDLIVVVGFSFASALEKIAPEFPDTKFVIVDMVVELPNVQSIIFKEHEGSFLVGMLAAMKSQTGKVGFVGGMDVPLIRKFALGYKEGAQYTNKDIEVFQNMTGTTPAAWGDPIKAGELARSQFDRGADVIFTAAGGSGMGVLQAAADLKKFSIGVDSNQNYIHPGSVLTSMVKRVDLAVYEAMRDAKDDSWKPGLKLLGLAEGGVDYALDKYNEALITDEMKAKVEAAKADIISGKIKVTNYFDIMDQ
ncbi:MULTISPECIES: BMP family ABC transporter substrate-binding protein [unclassified Pseudodesulfovibrio]|uniref:BMP family lipoprotein n=1 Tax=unclassified Pseudodesulfovibrio TaxID=2661612 RepID=UPI000FEB7BFB|nr:MULTISPECIES: BMP family ABC transporter substrate-binding protein [unclassified Pseudodesulfovibrio]MCJ2165087.1 BMP family ABC transporter substrate-binding protein [Pseudodesulfovibrio sp. S3-i]RWU03446.1 BMP family ABC transporter substrate-binding protein [Pseudodesulfovibrio sp. S3]